MARTHRRQLNWKVNRKEKFCCSTPKTRYLLSLVVSDDQDKILFFLFHFFISQLSLSEKMRTNSSYVKWQEDKWTSNIDVRKYKRKTSNKVDWEDSIASLRDIGVVQECAGNLEVISVQSDDLFWVLLIFCLNQADAKLTDMYWEDWYVCIGVVISEKTHSHLGVKRINNSSGAEEIREPGTKILSTWSWQPVQGHLIRLHLHAIY